MALTEEAHAAARAEAAGGDVQRVHIIPAIHKRAAPHAAGLLAQEGIRESVLGRGARKADAISQRNVHLSDCNEADDSRVHRRRCNSCIRCVAAASPAVCRGHTDTAAAGERTNTWNGASTNTNPSSSAYASALARHGITHSSPEPTSTPSPGKFRPGHGRDSWHCRGDTGAGRGDCAGTFHDRFSQEKIAFKHFCGKWQSTALTASSR